MNKVPCCQLLFYLISKVHIYSALRKNSKKILLTYLLIPIFFATFASLFRKTLQSVNKEKHKNLLRKASKDHLFFIK